MFVANNRSQVSRGCSLMFITRVRSSVIRAVHHRGVSPADLEGPGPGLFPEDEVGAEPR